MAALNPKLLSMIYTKAARAIAKAILYINVMIRNLRNAFCLKAHIVVNQPVITGIADIFQVHQFLPLGHCPANQASNQGDNPRITPVISHEVFSVPPAAVTLSRITIGPELTNHIAMYIATPEIPRRFVLSSKSSVISAPSA